MNLAAVIHWKSNNGPGVRCFSDRAYAERRVERAGGRLEDLHQAGEVFVYWPPALGPFPDAATLAQWEAEYDARPVEKSLDDRVRALETLVAR